MHGGFAEPVDVQSTSGNPTAFCWRGRVYRVQGVLAYWRETGPWRQSASLRGLLAGDTSPGEGEREFWQVEAAAGMHATPGAYELCVDRTVGRPAAWSVTTLAETGRERAS